MQRPRRYFLPILTLTSFFFLKTRINANEELLTYFSSFYASFRNCHSRIGAKCQAIGFAICLLKGHAPDFGTCWRYFNVHASAISDGVGFFLGLCFTDLCVCEGSGYFGHL